MTRTMVTTLHVVCSQLCAVCIMQCALCSVHYAVCTLHNVQCAVCSVQCKMPTDLAPEWPDYLDDFRAGLRHPREVGSALLSIILYCTVCLSCVSLRSLDWASFHKAVGYTAEPLLSVFIILSKIRLSGQGGYPTMM